MIQVSENMIMFAPVSRPRKLAYLSFLCGLFLCLYLDLYLKDIGLFVLSVGCIQFRLWRFPWSEVRGKQPFFVIQISNNMTKDFEICNAGNNSTRRATSTHETRVSRSTQRSRKPSQTKAERLSLILFFQDKYPGIRSLKIKDTGRMFIARARAGKRFLHAGAFSLQNLHKAFEYECQIKASC